MKQIVRVPLLTTEFEKEVSLARVEMKKLTLGPLQKTGLHRHPCPVFGYIVQGSILFQLEGEGERILREGDAFYEPADQRVAHFDNPSTSQNAVFVALYGLGEHQDQLIERLE